MVSLRFPARAILPRRTGLAQRLMLSRAMTDILKRLDDIRAPARAAARISSRRLRMSVMARDSINRWARPVRRGKIARAGKRRETMAESELYKKGAAMRRRLMGDAAVEAAAKGIYSDPTMRKFIEVATETVFGALWTRPGLDLKTRALICVISDTCMGREPELALHLRMALRQGWTEEELTEVMLHLSGYIGVPIIRESMQIASKVFKEPRDQRAPA